MQSPLLVCPLPVSPYARLPVGPYARWPVGDGNKLTVPVLGAALCSGSVSESKILPQMQQMQTYFEHCRIREQPWQRFRYDTNADSDPEGL